jgi:hypothetical protein
MGSILMDVEMAMCVIYSKVFYSGYRRKSRYRFLQWRYQKYLTGPQFKIPHEIGFEFCSWDRRIQLSSTYFLQKS